jgi:hypothetical protein
MVQHTKTGKINHKILQMVTKHTRWPYRPNGNKIYQQLRFQDPTKFTQIGIFGLKTMPSGNPGRGGPKFCLSSLLCFSSFHSNQFVLSPTQARVFAWDTNFDKHSKSRGLKEAGILKLKSCRVLLSFPRIVQGCQTFLGKIYQNGGKYTK